MAPDRGENHSDPEFGSSSQTRRSPQVSQPLIGDEDGPQQETHERAWGLQSETRKSLADQEQPWRCQSEMGKSLAEDAAEGRHFTTRGVLIGLVVGILICFSNTFFGLQTGWVSGMTMPASLIGFAFFKTFSKHLRYPFSPVENVLVQTVATSVGMMPLGSGFVSVIPALEYLLTPEENGSVTPGLGDLIIWSLGLCFFGVVFGVPLRKQFIIREELKFPSGTATALMIDVLHGGGEKGNAHQKGKAKDELHEDDARDEGRMSSDQTPLMSGESTGTLQRSSQHRTHDETEEEAKAKKASNWKCQIRLLLVSFFISGLYTLVTYFVPQLRHIPFLGRYMAYTWLWTFNLSPAYAAQGIIMGPVTTCHMFIGAVVGWGILSPLAKKRGWAPGPVKDWEHGSKGWIIWVSLAIMLADSIISLGWLALKALLPVVGGYILPLIKAVRIKSWRAVPSFIRSSRGYVPLATDREPSGSLNLDQPRSSQDSHPAHIVKRRGSTTPSKAGNNGPKYVDAPPDQLISNRTVTIGLVTSLVFCIVAIRISFGNIVPIYATIMACMMALLLSVMGARALGTTDLNPVSGISKLTQLVFALIIPRSNKNSVLINIVGGAISEAGALQAGDMLQDLKTGHLLAASPKAQFHGQLIGSFVGAIASAMVYKLYTSVYPVPGDLFPVPTGYVWVFTARLVTGQGLPPMAWEYALGAGVLFAVISALRIATAGRSWQSYIPGGIAVAIGMYNVPSFTLARTIGGLISWYWTSSFRRRGSIINPNITHSPADNTHDDGARDESDDTNTRNESDTDRKDSDQEETLLIVLASGLILGEGVVSIVNLGLASAGVRHL